MSEVALLSKPGLMEGEGCPRAVVMTRPLKQQGVDSSPSHHKQGVGGTMITITGKASLASKGPDPQRIMAMVDRTWHPWEQEIGTTKGTIQLVPAEQIRMNDQEAVTRLHLISGFGIRSSQGSPEEQTNRMLISIERTILRN